MRKTKSEIINELKSKNIELYINPKSPEHFSHPELYPPLYQILYNSLLKGETPPFLEESRFNRNDIIKSKSTFDRYLCAIYPSRFEASNPFELEDKKANNEEFEIHLEKEYKRVSSSNESINYRRERQFIKEISGFSKLPKSSKSAIYKIINTILKASAINHNWRGLIRYPKSTDKNQMDNIVNFNQIRDKHAIQNTALIKMVFFEIDQGRKNGDETYSQYIKLIPFAFDYLARVIEGVVFDSISTKNIKLCEIEDIIKRLSVKTQYDLKYKDDNQRLKDYFLLGMLKNIEMNILSSKKTNINYLERNVNFDVSKFNDWVITNEADSEIFKSFNKLSHNSLSESDFEISKKLRDLLMMNELLEPHGPCIKLKISCIIIKNIQEQHTWKVKNGVQGSNTHTYSPINEFLKFCKEIDKEDLKIDRVIVTRIRPTTLFMLNSIYRKIIWELDSKNYNRLVCPYTFEETLSKSYEIGIEILESLQRLNHMACLYSISKLISNVLGRKFDIRDEFWRHYNDDEMQRKLDTRKDIRWSPIEGDSDLHEEKA
ncbi:MAG: hypothetical protein K6L60_12610 [Oceanobacter sp.]